MSACNTLAAYFLGTYLCPLPARHVICTWIIYWNTDIHCETSWIKHVLLERLSELHHAIVNKSHTFFTQTEVVAREIINSQTINGILCPHWHDIFISHEMYITCNELINHIIALATELPRVVGQTLRRFTTSRKLIWRNRRVYQNASQTHRMACCAMVEHATRSEGMQTLYGVVYGMCMHCG